MTKMKLNGLKKVRLVSQKLEKMKAQYTGAFAAALFQKGAEIFAESQEEVPVDTGRLRASGLVAPPPSIYEPVVYIAYGTKYGLYVHEDQTKRHGPVIGRGKGQKYKYLEDPFNRAMTTFKSRMAYLTKRNIKLGIWNKPKRKLKGTKGPNAKRKRARIKY